jgi:hypothetical protein
MSDNSTHVEPMALQDMLARLKEAGVMVTQDAFRHLVTDHYDSIGDVAAKSKLRWLKHRYKPEQPLPRMDTMEEHLQACGIKRLDASWWQFPVKEVACE